jgi:hypothetical protein
MSKNIASNRKSPARLHPSMQSLADTKSGRESEKESSAPQVMYARRHSTEINNYL